MNRNPLTVIHKQESRLMLLSGIHHFNFLEGNNMAKEKTNWFIVIILWLAGIAATMQFAKFSFVQALNPVFPVVFISRILEGISHLGIVVTAPVIMLILSSEKHHSIVMGLWSSFFGVAFSVTAWAGKPIMELYSVSGLFCSRDAAICNIFNPVFLNKKT
jgi:hypothetical protein